MKAIKRALSWLVQEYGELLYGLFLVALVFSAYAVSIK